MPTDRRMGQLRKDGTVFHSHDLAQVATLIAAIMVLQQVVTGLFSDMKLILAQIYRMIGANEQLSVKQLENILFLVLKLIGPELVIILLVVSVVAVVAVGLQTKWCVREEKIKFRFDMINPIAGLKRIFSVWGFVQTLKSILKLALILPIAYFALKGFAPQMVMLMHTSIEAELAFIGDSVVKVFWKIAYLLIVLAIFDYVWGKYNWLKQNKMTKDEVKDERRAIEGDEETRRRIQWKGIQRVMQRIKNSVKQADVVITNPTHYAVALKYDRNSMAAPQVVAKGRGHMAQHIKKLAREAGIPVLERKVLARALYSSVEVGATIPRELYRAVAEVLAYIYRLKNPWAAHAAAGAQS